MQRPVSVTRLLHALHSSVQSRMAVGRVSTRRRAIPETATAASEGRRGSVGQAIGYLWTHSLAWRMTWGQKRDQAVVAVFLGRFHAIKLSLSLLTAIHSDRPIAYRDLASLLLASASRPAHQLGRLPDSRPCLSICSSRIRRLSWQGTWLAELAM